MTEQLHWQQHGGHGPFLLLVHGFLSSRAQWRPNLEALKEICQPVTVELFGHAHSPTPTDSRCYDPAYYVQCLEGIRQHLGVDRWLLLGYSLGAALTLRYAFEHPQHVIGHLFTNSTSAFADTAQQTAWRANAAALVNNIRAQGSPAMERIAVHPRHARTLPEAVYQALVADTLLHTPEGIANTLEFTNPVASVRARITENVRPACLIQGTRERRFKPLADFARRHMPQLEIIEIDAGHAVNMQAPQAFNRAVSEFASRCHTS